MVTNIQVRSKGTFTLPSELRRKYGVNEGDFFSLIDLGDGNFLFTPKVAQAKQLSDRITKTLEEDGVSLDDLLTALDEERERFYQEHYVKE
jgi:bifunctional DNA-binding transcriptional regulator/antitoxin component of YhaV-PrlF toxin-antitoxin module